MKHIRSLMLSVSALSAIPAQALPLLDNGVKFDFLSYNTKTQVTHFDDENPNVKWIVMDRITLNEDPQFGPEFALAYNNSNRPATLTLRVRAGLSEDMLNHALDLQSQGFDVRVIQPTTGTWSLLFTDEKGVDRPLVAAGAVEGPTGEIVFGRSVTPQVPAVLRLDVSPPGVAKIVDSLRAGMAVQLRYTYTFRALLDSLKASVEIDWQKVSSTLQQTNLTNKTECMSGGITGTIYYASLNLGAQSCAYDSKYINNLTRTMVEKGDIKISFVDSDTNLAKEYRSLVIAQISKLIQDAAFAPLDMKLSQNLNAPNPAAGQESCLTTTNNGAKSPVDVFGKPATAQPPNPSTTQPPNPSTTQPPNPSTTQPPNPSTTPPPNPNPGPAPAPVPPGAPTPSRPASVQPTAATSPAPQPAAASGGSVPTPISIDFKFCQQKSNYYVYDKRESFESKKISYTFDLKSIQEFQGEVTGSLNNLCEQSAFTKKFVNVDERSGSEYSYGCPVRSFNSNGRWLFWNKKIEDYAYSQGTINEMTSLPIYVPTMSKGISVYGGWGSKASEWKQ